MAHPVQEKDSISPVEVEAEVEPPGRLVIAVLLNEMFETKGYNRGWEQPSCFNTYSSGRPQSPRYYSDYDQRDRYREDGRQYRMRNREHWDSDQSSVD